jgi:asparagine synthase (glutamine-hydrolysing)
VTLRGTYLAGPPGRLTLADRPATGTDETWCSLDGTVTNLSVLADTGGTPPDAPPETVVARAFETLGDRVLDRIHGTWAVVIWDRRRKAGLAAKDPVGSRPLHYATLDRGIEFASEIADLLARLDRSPELDRRAVAHWLARRPLPFGSTLLEGIRRLPAGHLLRLEAGASKPQRWWVPRYAPPQALCRGEAADALRQGMEAAVRRATGEDASTGLMLSGGFDSLSVAALTPGGARAYSMVFPGLPDVDESERINLAGEAQGLDLATIEFAPASPIDAAAEFAATWGVPQATPNRFVWRQLLEQPRHDGVVSLLDGEGGDELFGCSPPLIADRLRAGRPAAAVALARRLPGYRPELAWPWTKRALRLYGLRDGLPPRAHRLARRFGVGTLPPLPAWLSNEARGLLDRDRDLDWKRLDGPRWWAGLVRVLLEGPDAMGTADELRRIGAMHRLDRRHPWRDRELIELVLGLPPELAFEPKHDRPLAREAMKGSLDERLRREAAKPFFNRLLNDALAGPDRPRLEHALFNGLPEPLVPLVEQGKLKREVRIVESGPGGWGASLWPLLSASIWLHKRTN